MTKDKEQTPVSDTVVVAARVTIKAKKVLERHAKRKKVRQSDVVLAALNKNVPGFAEANG